MVALSPDNFTAQPTSAKPNSRKSKPLPHKLHQFSNRFVRIIAEVMRPSCQIRHGPPARVESEMVKQRRENFLEMHRTILRLSRVRRRRANDLTRSHAAAREQGAADLGPVVSARLLVDLWCPAEFTPDQHRHVPV